MAHDPDSEETQFTDPGEQRLWLGEVIGTGGTAEVLEARQTVLGREVAVKRPLGQGSMVRHALLEEAYVTGRLEHPNIVPIHDIDFHHGEPMIVMKRLRGLTWDEVIDAPEQHFPDVSDPLAFNLDVLLAVCNAVAYAHDQGILHRDLKPENVMIGHFGEVWLVDWGLAVSLHGHDPKLPNLADMDRICGTPAYMAPEMGLVRADMHGPATDVFLLGGILHRIVTGRPPRLVTDLQHLVDTLIRERIPIDPELPLAGLLANALAWDPTERPQTVEAFRRTLVHWIDRRGVQQLLASARDRLDELRQGLDDGLPRTVLYDRFGATRFAFRQVLESWSDAPGAHEGLDEALRRMIDYELGHGDDRAASLLLAELAAPDPALIARAEALQIEREEQDDRLLRLERDSDTTLATGPRLIAGLLLGLAWIGFPLLSRFAGLEGYPYELAVTLPTMLVTAFVILAAIPWFATTRLNRTLVLAVTLSPMLAGAVLLACWLLDVPSTTATALKPIAFLAMTTMAAVLGDLRLLPSAGIFLVAFLMGAWMPTMAPIWLVFANLGVIVNALLIWGPTLVRHLIEEA